MNRIITLTTDFGSSDSYVGVMKGVILGINPNARIIDICHEIKPQNIEQASYVISTAWPFFPNDTIHVVVVDPGVGSQRKAIVAKAAHSFLLAPDNGIISNLHDDITEAVNLTNSQYLLPSISNTFHGRDIFAPVAAHLSLGIELQEFGERVSSFVKLSSSKPVVQPDGVIIGRIINIDHFGNLITNIGSEFIPTNDIYIEVKGHTINGLSVSYVQGDDLLAIVGSDGNIQISMRNGNAAELLNLKCNDFVKIGSTRLKT